MKKCVVSFEEIISLENLCEAWEEFVKGKRYRQDVEVFRRYLGDEIVQLYTDLTNGEYRHGGYDFFTVNDPKRRNIHKASVRDRLLHHAVHRKLYDFFAGKFIAASFSCQAGKGLHRALLAFRRSSRKVSKNNTGPCWVLKCDIKKFFDSIQHATLLAIIARNIKDKKLIGLLEGIIRSFGIRNGCGLPLGNLTSQLFANIYMNEFDQFVKHELCHEHYLRYADDFVFLSPSRSELLLLIPKIEQFVRRRLCLQLHPMKIFLKTLSSGVDFLGWVHFLHHRVLRTITRRRILRRSRRGIESDALQSYLGLLRHGDTFAFRQEIENNTWLWGKRL